jgi:uncharacterized protein
MDHQAAGSQCPADVLIIVGASARALAQSAATAGWAVHAADLFADDDLRTAAVQATRVDPRGYPSSLMAAVTQFPPGAWCYTGAIENHPQLIDDLAMLRPLAGNAGPAVRAVRDPFLIQEVARAAGLLFPDTHEVPAGLPRDGSFLVKPRASGSGRSIHSWTPGAPDHAQEAMIWQRHVPGVPHAASFIMAHGRARLLGLSRQLIGEPWCTGRPFTYGGSVTLSVAESPPRLAATAAEIGAVLAERFDLVGAIGVDFVVDANGRPWILEVNPRVTASMELHERATGISIAAAHLEACTMPRRTAATPTCGGDGRNWAKAVLHAAAPLAITAARVAEWRARAEEWAHDDGGRPAIADIPTPDQILAARAPVLTVFARGDSADAALTAIRRRALALAADWMPSVSPPSAAATPPPPHARCTA